MDGPFHPKVHLGEDRESKIKELQGYRIRCSGFAGFHDGDDGVFLTGKVELHYCMYVDFPKRADGCTYSTCKACYALRAQDRCKRLKSGEIGLRVEIESPSGEPKNYSSMVYIDPNNYNHDSRFFCRECTTNFVSLCEISAVNKTVQHNLSVKRTRLICLPCDAKRARDYKSERSEGQILQGLLKDARAREKKKGHAFTLTMEEMVSLSNESWEVSVKATNERFSMVMSADPSMFNKPSLERIDENLGYTLDNVRLIPHCLNTPASLKQYHFDWFSIHRRKPLPELETIEHTLRNMATGEFTSSHFRSYSSRLFGENQKTATMNIDFGFIYRCVSGSKYSADSRNDKNGRNPSSA